MNIHERALKRLKRYLTFLEVFIAIIIGITVILGIPDLFKYMYNIVVSPQRMSYEIFGDFLKHVLMLVVGLEMIVMIVTHSHESILTLVLFVIARKMLVYADGMLDIFIGTLSIGVIFFIIRHYSSDEKLLAKYDNTFSASIPVEKIRREFHMDLPTNFSHTLGGLIYALAKEEAVPIEEGSILTYGRYRYKIVRVNDGVIERILIEENA